MKKIILILVLIGGLSVGGSYQVGKIVETELPRVLKRVGELGQMQISITAYERNIFRSTVRSEIVLASISGSREQLSLRHDIWHGPFPFGKTSSGQWQFTPLSALVETRIDQSVPPSGMIGELFELFPELYATTELTRFDFAGNGTSTFTVPGFDKSLPSAEGNLDVSWEGLSGTALIDKSMQKMEGALEMPSIRVSGEKDGVIIENLRSSYNIFEDFGGLLLGNVTIDSGLIEVGDARSKTTLTDLQFRNDARLDNDLVSYSVAMGIEKLDTGDQAYGPAGFELDFTNLDAASILDVQMKLQKIHSEVKTLSEEEIANRVFAIYAEALPGLIEKAPEIKLNYLNLTGPGGEFYCKGNIVFDNRLNRTIKSINSLLGILRVEGESVVSKPLLQNMLVSSIKNQLNQARSAGQLGDISDDQFNAMAAGTAAEQLAQLEARGTLVSEGDNYQANFSFRDNQAFLNGKPLN